MVVDIVKAACCLLRIRAREEDVPYRDTLDAMDILARPTDLLRYDDSGQLARDTRHLCAELLETGPEQRCGMLLEELRYNNQCGGNPAPEQSAYRMLKGSVPELKVESKDLWERVLEEYKATHGLAE